MKKQILLLAISACIFGMGCHKDPSGELTGGVGFAKKDGAPWESILYSKFGAGGLHSCENCIYISLETYSPEGYLRESFGIDNVPFEKGRFLFSPPSVSRPIDAIAVASFANLIGHGDQVSGNYSAIPNDPDNFVEITEIHGEKIKGIFKATLVLDSLYHIADPTLPDTIRFENGTFESQ